MNESTSSRPSSDAALDLARQLELRLARIEHRLGITAVTTPWPALNLEPTDAPPAVPGTSANVAGEDLPTPAPEPTRDPEELEYEVGQAWFARIGIIVLAIGVTFLLSLPFANLPSIVPPLGGYVIAGVLLLLAHFGRTSFELAAKYAHGAGMMLLFFSTLRLFFHGGAPALETTSLLGRGLLVLAVAINLVIAVRRHSPALVGLVLLTGCVAALFVGTPWFVLGGLTLLAGVVIAVAHRFAWPGFALLGQSFILATYVCWNLAPALLGHSAANAVAPVAAPFFVLGWMVMFSAGALAWPAGGTDQEPARQVGALFNAGASYLVFLAHILARYEPYYLTGNFVATVAFLAVAVGCWVRGFGRIATFVYAIAGYQALSLAIIKMTAVPEVFVWLALQSLVVVATAIWFRSRFIVVANFLIGAAIVLAYVVLAPRETGICLAFGVVALVTARILNWQKDRLELETDAMRIAYLVGAFVVFPYALYHLVPQMFVVPAWVGLALFYYAINLIIQNPKYRWMGHGTLLLTVIYSAVIGLSRLDGTARVLSLLILGTILLIVSFVFTRVRAHAHRAA